MQENEAGRTWQSRWVNTTSGSRLQARNEETAADVVLFARTQMDSTVDLQSQNLVQNRQYRDTVRCLPAHTEQRFVKVAEVRIICTRSGSIVILLPPTHQQGSRNNQRHQMNQRCTMMTKLVLCSEPHACAQTAVRQMMIVR